VLAATAFRELSRMDPAPTGEAAVVQAVDAVAALLGNTRAVCRKCYVHPEVLAAYEEGALERALDARAVRRLARDPSLRPIERAVLGLLRRRQSTGRRRRASTVAAAAPARRSRGARAASRPRITPLAA
jgi:DNA topoisomerase-1